MVSERFAQVLELVWMGRNSVASGSETDINVHRANLERLDSLFPVPGDIVDETVAIAGVPCRWLDAPGVSAEHVTIYLHGGAYVAGSARSHGQLSARIGRSAGTRVLSVDYRLAPEHPFPAAIEDAVAVVDGVIAEIGIDPAHVALAGDSAGGGLTAATLVSWRDRGEPQLGAAVMLSPWLDLTGTAESYRSLAHLDPILEPDPLLLDAAMYLNGVDPTTPLASPVFADLAGLPPLLIQSGDHEILRDDSVSFAGRAREAGVDVTLEIEDEMLHVFQIFPDIPESLAATDRIGAFLQKHLF